MIDEEEYTSIEVLGSNDVVLVGEEHYNEYSRGLAEGVLEQITPAATAVESTGDIPSSAGMNEIGEYGKSHNLPVILLDEQWKQSVSLENKRKCMKYGNEFSSPILENGDLEDESAIYDARGSIWERCGQDVWEVFYPFRERHMAGRLMGAVEKFGSPIVAGVGVFHVQAIKEMYGRVDRISLLSNRVIGKATEPTKAAAD